MLHRLHQVVSRGIRCVADIDKRQRLDRLQEGLRIDYDNLANGGIVAIVFYQESNILPRRQSAYTYFRWVVRYLCPLCRTPFSLSLDN